MKHTNRTLLFSAVLALSLGVSCGQAKAADIAPEVASSVWEEGTVQCADVTLNGKEIIAFRGPIGAHSAEEKAEDLADKLQDLVQDQKFDPDKLLPAREGELAVLRVDGNTLLKFEPDQGKGTSGSALEQSFKLANTLRTALGSTTLPPSFLKLAQGRETLVAKLGNCFSGAASWYGGKFHGRKCSDGSKYDQNALTAAHRSLPFGTKLLVMNRKTGDSCVVQVNDRGPFVDGRVIDLSRGAAQQLNMLSSGVAMVDCLVLGGQ